MSPAGPALARPASAGSTAAYAASVPHLLRRLGANRQGATALETALILPLLLVLVIGAADLASAFGLQMQLMQAAHAGAEFVAAEGSQVPTDDAIRNQVSLVTGLPSSAIAVSRRLECDGVPAPAGATACAGMAAESVTYLVLTVSAAVQPLSPIPLTSSFAPRGQLSQSASVRLP